MGNAIVNESKIEKDFKQIYPNNKDVKIRIEFWRDSLPLIIRGWQTRRLTIIESINERDSFFLTNAEYYTDNSVIHMYLTKNSQTQRYGISNIYITTNGNDETILLTEENSKDYKTIAQNFKESLLVNDCKLVYPNHKKMNVMVFAKRIEVRIFAKKFFSLIKKAQNIEQLTPIQKILHWGQLFLTEESYKYIKDLKKDDILVKFFNKDGEEKFVFSTVKIYDEKGAPYYSLYPKKIKEIYLNFSSKSVIIILDEKFKTKKEKAWIKKDKKKGDFTKNLESLIS